MSTPEDIENDVERYVAAYLAVSEAADRLGYRAADSREALPEAARGEGAAWCRRFLNAAVDPHQVAASSGYHPAGDDTYDLVRHEIAASGDVPALAVVESRIFQLVRVVGAGAGFDALDEAGKSAHLASYARWLFRGTIGGAVWSPRPTGGWSTAVGTHLATMPDAEARADAGVLGEDLWFLTYRVSAGAIGGPDPRDWFEASYR